MSRRADELRKPLDEKVEGLLILRALSAILREHYSAAPPRFEAAFLPPVAFARILSYARHMELLSHDELVRLTPLERLALISQLWDSLEDDHLSLTAAQHAELDHRLATLDQDRSAGITWAALKAELEQRCP